MKESMKTTIRLLGNDYAITCNDSEEYVHRVAFYVDKKLTEITGRNSRLSTNMAAVLASVNIADELFKTRENLEQTESAKTAVEEKNKENEKALLAMKREAEVMRQEIQRLKIEIAKLEVRR